MKKHWKAVAALVLAIAVLAGVWTVFRPKGTEGTKDIQILVVYEDGSDRRFSFQTGAACLGEALEEQSLIEGEEGPYGLYITAVNGVEADSARQQWWCVTKGGQRVDTGVDQTPLADGDQFELTLTTGY